MMLQLLLNLFSDISSYIEQHLLGSAAITPLGIMVIGILLVFLATFVRFLIIIGILLIVVGILFLMHGAGLI